MTGRAQHGATRPLPGEAAIWHDVECGGYTADLPLWHELASAARGRVLELGAGTGRVALDLARRGHPVSALDADPALIESLRGRARERGVRVQAHTGDARAFCLGTRYSLVIAPMQVVQLLGGAEGTRAMLSAVRRHMAQGATLALALADPLEGLPADSAMPPLPDVREVGGWVYSSRPVAMREEAGSIAIDRVREAVSPAGDLLQSAVTLLLDRLGPSDLEAMAVDAGFRRLPRRSVPATDAYVGSHVVMLEPA